MGRIRRTTAVVATLLVAALPLPLPAQAADMNTCGYVKDVKVVFEGSIPFTDTEKNRVLAGFRQWQYQVDTYKGYQPHVISTSAGTKVTVRWDSALTSGTYGTGICSSMRVSFNSDYRTTLFEMDPASFTNLAAHELGHVVGYNHVHHSDSRDGHTPTMAACSWGVNYLRQDDETAVQLLTDVTGGWRSATANSSFEEDGSGSSFRQHWYLSSGATASRSSPGVDSTPNFARFENANSRPYMFITSSLIDDPTIDWVKGRVNYRRMSTSHSGSVEVKLRVRTYSVGGDNCGVPSRRKEGAASRSYGTSYWYIKTCAVTSTSWNYCTTSGQNPPARSATTGGIDVRIYVYNDMWRTGSGIREEVGIDRTRVMVDF